MDRAIGSCIESIARAARRLWAFARPRRPKNPIAAAIACAHLFALSAQAVQVQLQLTNEGVAASRSGRPASSAPQGAGTLAHGTVLEVPDRYFKDDSGRLLTPETAVMRWLSTAQAEGSRSPDAAIGCDAGEQCMLFPVKLLRAGAGSSLDAAPGNEVLLPLAHLMRNNHLIILSEDAVATPAPPSTEARGKPQPADEDHQRPDTGRSGSQMQMQAACVGCRHPEARGQSSLLDAKLAALAPALRALGAAALTRSGPAPRSTPRNFITDAVRSNFNATCGASFDAWAATVRQKAAQRQIPEDILFGLINQESTGRCTVTGSSGEIGLMQILPTSSTLPACRSGGARNPECERALRNPFIALDQAIQILERNRAFVMQPRMVAGGGRLPRVVADGFAANTPVRMQWRLAVFSYNQGPYYAARAKAYMDAYNARHGGGLRPERWADFRPSILSALLEGTSLADKRRALHGLSYAESVVPYST